MRQSRFKEEQVIGIRRSTRPGCRRRICATSMGVSDATFYKWRSKYGGMGVSDARKLKALEEENRRLKKLLAELMLDASMLKEMLRKNF